MCLSVYLTLQLCNLFDVTRLQSLRKLMVQGSTGLLLSCLLVLHLQELYLISLKQESPAIFVGGAEFPCPENFAGWTLE